jgi:uncharacterized membrane protein YqjE
MPDLNPTGGLFSQLQGSLRAVTELLRVRLALVGTELELEKQRIGQGLLWGVAALLSLTVAAVLMCGFVILLLWDGYRLAAVGVLAVFFLSVGMRLLQSAQHRLSAESNLFSASLAELERDGAALSDAPPHAP